MTGKQVIKPEQFTKVVKGLIDEASEETVTKVNEAAYDEAKQCVREIKAASKAEFGTGKYQRGWTSRKKKLKDGYYTYTIWNRSRYMLTHLLEYGHQVWIHGPKGTPAHPTSQYTKAHTHIRPVAEASSERYYQKIIERLIYK